MVGETPSKKAKVEEAPHIADIIHEERLKAKVNFNAKRVRKLAGNDGYLARSCKTLIYYMHRDQRVQDNWALIYAQKLAIEHRLPLNVVCFISTKHPKNTGCTLRTLDFCLKGLQEVQKECTELNIGFELVTSQGVKNPGQFLGNHLTKHYQNPAIVTDFSALRSHRKIVDELVENLSDDICIHQVDAHNIVPIWQTSDKQEYAARNHPKQSHEQIERVFDRISSRDQASARRGKD